MIDVFLYNLQGLLSSSPVLVVLVRSQPRNEGRQGRVRVVRLEFRLVLVQSATDIFFLLVDLADLPFSSELVLIRPEPDDKQCDGDEDDGGHDGAAEAH